MAKVNLSLTKSYVPEWTVQHGLREMMSNALDGATAHGAKPTVEYNVRQKYLVISNPVSGPLPVANLLLGESGSRKRADAIGQFGEGMSLGFLALIRDGLKVDVLNANETWSFEFQFDAVFAREVLVCWTKAARKPEAKFAVTIYGVEPEVYAEFQKKFLFFSANDENCPAELSDPGPYGMGRFLVGPDVGNRIYSKGVYLKSANLCLEWNGQPVGVDLNHITINRDRAHTDMYSVGYNFKGLLERLSDEAIAGLLLRNGSPDHLEHMPGEILCYLGDSKKITAALVAATDVRFAVKSAQQTEHEFNRQIRQAESITKTTVRQTDSGWKAKLLPMVSAEAAEKTVYRIDDERTENLSTALWNYARTLVGAVAHSEALKNQMKVNTSSMTGDQEYPAVTLVVTTDPMATDVTVTTIKSSADDNALFGVCELEIHVTQPSKFPDMEEGQKYPDGPLMPLLSMRLVDALDAWYETWGAKDGDRHAMNPMYVTALQEVETIGEFRNYVSRLFDVRSLMVMELTKALIKGAANAAKLTAESGENTQEETDEVLF